MYFFCTLLAFLFMNLFLYALHAHIITYFLAIPSFVYATVFLLSWVTRFPFWRITSDEDRGFSEQTRVNWGTRVTHPYEDYGYMTKDLYIKEKDLIAGDQYYLRGWEVPCIPKPIHHPNAFLTAIVCIHGPGEDRRAFMRMLPVFHDAGFGVVLFDLRDHGLSQKSSKGMGFATYEALDVAAVAKYVRQDLKYKNVVVYGVSHGASAAIVAACCLDSNIAGVIAESAFMTREAIMRKWIEQTLGCCPWGFRLAYNVYIRLIMWTLRSKLGLPDDGTALYPEPLDAICLLSPRPILFMHGKLDKRVPMQHSQELYDKAKDPKTIWIEPKGEHMLLFDQYPQEWKKRVLDFLHNSVLSDASLKIARSAFEKKT
eukprot:TRINITY_DN2196_c0_g1_i1.p1 TRINITY_DN2196_c0_g1~~TRINITY_DN2196_c0_g1_i1.p1  ORF type:complete len:378 (-),score=69.42 TRINITY_DN2196_c0_g1_i1:175-1287(-)